MRFIIAMTGATGAARDVRLLAAFRKLEAETCRVLSRWAEVRPTKSHGFSARECAIIATRVPAFNGNPKSTDDPVDPIVGRPHAESVWSQLPRLKRWKRLRQPDEWSVDQL